MKKTFLPVLLAAVLAAAPGSVSAAAEEAGVETAYTEGFSFADVEGWRFAFSSGAGAWGTELVIYADGSFEGNYHDSEMGATGEGYPNGSIYVSDFSGHFTSPEQVDDTTYVFQIADLSYAHDMGEEINSEEGVLYIYTDAYGLDDAENMYLYLPGSGLSNLPEGFLNWAGYASYGAEALENSRLPYYGLYNEAAQEGFVSSVPDTEMTAAQQIWAVIRDAQYQASGDEYALSDSANRGQDELTEAASNLYTIWDDALNEIWAILKANLDEGTMNQLTDEELVWIDEKEATAGGDSLTAARMTQERVYELTAYVN